jgi:sugar/nucleoside kinase (ribokinase family)
MTTEVLCIGQAVVDCITRGVENDPFGRGKTRAASITLNLGGDAVNESFVLASLGHKAGLMCAVGDDLAGRFVMNEASRRGLDVSGVSVIDGIATPVANMFVKLDGSRSSVTSAASMLPGYVPSADHVRACISEGARIVSFASLFRAPLDQPEVVCSLIRAAHESGAIVCADTKIPTFRSMCLEDLGPVLPMIDYIFPNETEAAFLTGMSEGDDADYSKMADALLDRGICHVVIKTGEKGLPIETHRAATEGP